MDVLLATTNRHKIAEYMRLFAGSSITLVTCDDVGLLPPAVVEDGFTFAVNAAKKATAFAGIAGMLTLADDSGISVDVLAGAPGVRSARFGAPSLDDAGRMHFLLECLTGIPRGLRGAHYTCALVLASENGVTQEVEGRLYGEIALEATRGTTGFGYDPLFIVPRFGITVADVTPDQKDEISHRGNAVRRLLSVLDSRHTGVGTLEL
jgi:XTP/dITP diphosphohydrolase